MSKKRSIIIFTLIILFIFTGIMFFVSVFNKNIDTKNITIAPNNTASEAKLVNSEEQYKVIRVIDGDTIVILYQNNEEKLRLIGVNTPESVDPRKKVECFGKEASSYTKNLLENRNVRLEFDETQSKRDKYGRMLAYVYRDDDLFINKELIRNGYGYEYTYNFSYKYVNEFKAAQKFAKENEFGLWKPNICNNK